MPDLLRWIVPADALVPPGAYIATSMTAAMLVGISKAGFGGGVGALATPLILLVLPAPTALALTLPMLLGCDIFTFRHFSREWDRTAFRSLFPWMFGGLFLGLGLLVVFARGGSRGDLWIRFAAGVSVVGLTSLSLLPGRFAAPARRTTGKPSTPAIAAIGLVCGITTMVAHAAGVLLNLFLLRRRPSPASFVGTSTRIYLTFNALKVPLFVAASPLAGRAFLTWRTFGHSLWLLPAGWLGVRIGARLHRSFTPDGHRATVTVLLLVSGAYLTASSWLALARP